MTDPKGNDEVRGVVLIVDDDQSIREMMELALQMDHYATAVARNGAAALEWLRQNQPPSLILLDLMMPVVDGWQVLEQLADDERLARVPVVVITAFHQDLGIAAQRPMLKKPIELMDLLRVVESYCCAGA